MHQTQTSFGKHDFTSFTVTVVTFEQLSFDMGSYERVCYQGTGCQVGKKGRNPVMHSNTKVPKLQ